MEKVIKLDVVNIDIEDNTYFQYTNGYYSSYEMVEKIMPSLFVIKEDTIFLTEEIPIDKIITNEDSYTDFVTQRQYRWIGDEIKMIHETPYNFNGYKSENDYQYKVGDIIQYIEGNGRIGISIIGGVPLLEKGKEQYLDYTDDSYIVYDLGKGDTHDHIMSCNIIGFANVTPDTYKAYKDKLKERLELQKKRE